MSEIYNETIKMTFLVQKTESEPKETPHHFASFQAGPRSAALVFFDLFARADHTFGKSPCRSKSMKYLFPTRE